MVVTSGQQIRRLSDASRALAAVQARVLGVLLNRTDVPSYGYTYRTLSRSVDNEPVMAEPAPAEPEPPATRIVPAEAPGPAHVAVLPIPDSVQRPPQPGAAPVESGDPESGDPESGGIASGAASGEPAPSS
jgi:hypothetical protein